MVRNQNTKIPAVLKMLPLAVILLLGIQACKKSRSDLGKTLFTETGNKVFKNMEGEAFTAVFKETLEAQKSTLAHPELITAWYERNDYMPTIVLGHIKHKGFNTIISYFDQSAAHGFNPELFKTARLKQLVQQFYEKKGIRTTEEAYKKLAELELLSANALITYSNALQYGLIDPKKVYASYFIDTKRPDSLAINRVFTATDLKVYLDSIQPKDKQYLLLQKALKEGLTAKGMSAEESRQALMVNLERLRWKNKPAADKYVNVNIADFRLDVIDHGKSILDMKVCVGEGRKTSGLKKDRPFSRETPQLNSLIHSVQVDPVWNIPESIATNEITKYAAADRYYLANHNIDVFEDGKLIDDPELIDWSAGNPGKKYTFKQRPGEDNSLGKIKFLFANQSSVYLHDTPAKAAFNLPVRAISHGCVRLEKPLELAEVLFGPGAKYDDIKKRMESDGEKEAKNINLPEKVPVYLTYTTAWTDENDGLQFRKDIYGLDLVLYAAMQKTGAV